MSPRRFRADVSSAAAKVQSAEIPGVIAIGRGGSNGEVVITYRHDSLPSSIRLRAVAQNTSEYPDGNNFMLFTESDDAPTEVANALQHVQEYLLGITVTEMVMEVANAVTLALTANPGHEDARDDEDEVMTDYGDTLSCGGDSESEDNDFIGNDDEYFGLGTSQELYQQPLPSGNDQSGVSPCDRTFRQRIKSDLQVAKKAGFRVGVLKGLGTTESTGITCISLRVSKLGLSEEALLAWDVRDTDYAVLLIKYDTQYLPLEKIVELPAAHSGVQFRIGLCEKYKPEASDAAKAFSSPDNTSTETSLPGRGNSGGTFRSMLMSASLDQFMNESLISIIKIRLSRSVSWDHANELLLRNSSMGPDGSATLDYADLQPVNKAEGSAAAGGIRSHILLKDHLLEADQALSFPLIAMQFAIRYFATCTRYCLRCHRVVEEGFEALRPYVCSNPLCLFQYMTMGLGPNVEHEILTEPSVVDLLVSLCYASLQTTTRYQAPMRAFSTSSTANTSTTFPIREFPVGLRLRVPTYFEPDAGRPLPTTVRLDRENTSLLYSDGAVLKRLRVNQWIVVRYRGPDKTSGLQPGPPDIQSFGWMHSARITGIFLDQMRVEIALTGRFDTSGAVPNTFPASMENADVYTYDVDFDTLADSHKSVAMQHVLNTLPPIAKIREYLSSCPSATLRSCEQVSPAAATLLMWIVSSNRSCINEIVTLDAAGPDDGQYGELQSYKWTVKEKRRQEYIHGINGYVQFRFSQGSPDKELRFNKALQEISRQKDLSQYPTIFAWHGSSVANWHSILRTGLDFKNIACGRVYGDGVYFSPLFATSVGYAMTSTATRWPNSVLNVQSILSLNEIINAPERFVSRTPHYVVQEEDWHQCRYLFVSSCARPGSANPSMGAAEDAPMVPLLPQAPGYEVRGPTGQPLSIPEPSMPARSRYAAPRGPLVTNRKTIRDIEEDSEESSAEDQELLSADISLELSRSSSVETLLARNTWVNPFPPFLALAMRQLTGISSGRNAPPTPIPEDPATDFRPGTLDLASLPRLAPPSWATPTASRAIGRELQKLQQIQTATPLRDLGWYINFEAVSNMFQWIVELHSFDPSTPLAQDMKAADVTSIVMEFRFGRDWPMTPPFVRVIRPRFMLFALGGGGHVTAGGAMCMELLTNSGWSPANSMESVLLQVRMALCSEERGARLDLTPFGKRMGDYRVGEAVDAYIRSAQVHGWEVPQDLRMTAYGGAEGSAY